MSVDEFFAVYSLSLLSLAQEGVTHFSTSR